MNSLILRATAPMIMGLTLVISIYVLLRGHNEPGGGFVGGLIGSAGLLFMAIARGRPAALALMRAPPVAWCAIGLLLATASGFFAWIVPGSDYLTHRWWFPDVGFKLPFGTTLLFDIGVYLTVVGTVTTMFFALMED